MIVSRGSTGVFAEGLLKTLGLVEQIATRLVREDRGSEAMSRLAESTARAVAFGALTEIASARGEGVVLVAPLPAELQNYTTYTAARMQAANWPDVAAAFLEFLKSPAAVALFRARGIER